MGRRTKKFEKPWCRGVDFLYTFKIRLPYLKRRNSWQSQWPLFTTPNKRYTAFFSMFSQLPIWPAAEVRVLIFTAHVHCFKLNVIN